MIKMLKIAVDQLIPSTDKPMSSNSGKAWVKQEQKKTQRKIKSLA